MIEFLHPWVLIALFVIPIIIWFFNKRSSSFEGTMRISSSSLLEGSFRKRGEFRYKIVLYLKILYDFLPFGFHFGISASQFPPLDV